MNEIIEKTSSSMFAPTFSLPEISVYSHGFSEEEVFKIKTKIKEIEKRDLHEFPVSLDEFKLYVVPNLRILRTEAFILNPIKEKITKEPKEKTIKAAKPKKLTKKAIQEKLNIILIKKAKKEELSQEEETFYNEQVATFALL